MTESTSPSTQRFRVIAMEHRKGGVGKTTATANLGAALARRGRRVLLIDSESQRNLTTYIGRADRRDDPNAATINEAYRAPKKYALEAIAPSVAEGVDLLYGSVLLEETEKEIITAQHPAAGLIMRRIVQLAIDANDYDYVLIDCPPSEGLITRNAIVAADVCLVPMQTDYSAFEGIGRLKELLLKLDAQDAFETKGMPPVRCIPYFVDERVGRSRELRDYLLSDEFTKNTAGDIDVATMRSQIHRNEAFPDSFGENLTIFDFARVDGRGRKRIDDGVLRGRNEFAALAEELDRA